MRFYIKEARERVGLSQKDLAEKLNLKPTTFNGYETGAHDPKSNILAKIATELRTTTDYLLGLTDNPEMPSSDYSFSAEYISLANKYRRLDAHGRDMVDIVLDKELTRSLSSKAKEENKPAQMPSKEESEHIKPVAARNDNASRKQQRLMRNDLDKLNKLNEH